MGFSEDRITARVLPAALVQSVNELLTARTGSR